MANDKISLNALLSEAESKNISLSTLLVPISAADLEITEAELLAQMADMLKVMEESAAYGLTGVRSHSGLTGGSAKTLAEAAAQPAFNKLLGDLATDAVTYALAVSECNAAMGRIVLLALKKHCNLSEDVLAKALVVAGNIGLVIAGRASLAGAVGGCQAECGSAAAMAAGAAVDALGGTPKQVGDAVSIVFKNMLGLVCDPVAGLVEVPCIKRNGGAAVQALLAAQLALAGVGSFIPADEAIDAMKWVGDSMPCALRETAGGGLAQTPSALAWAQAYFERQ